MLKFSRCAILLTLTAGMAASQPTVTWTGAAGDNSWNNPGNWDSGTVPTEADNVNIPAGTPACWVSGFVGVGNLTNGGTIAYQPGEQTSLTVAVVGNLSNSGTITNSQGATHIVSFGGTGIVQNSGVIAGSYVTIGASSVVNGPSGTIASTPGGAGINIVGGNEVNNQGAIVAGFCGSVSIETHWGSNTVTNSGLVRGGDGAEANGGSVKVTTGTLNNSGTIKPGNGAADHYDGQTKISANKVNNTGSLGGSSGTTLQHELGDLTLAADTVIISPGDSVVEGHDLRILGRVIIVSNILLYLFYESALDFRTTADGSVDFSGTHERGSIFGLYASRIYSNTILPPSEGLNYIFTMPPEIHAADTTFIGGYMGEWYAFGEAGATDTLTIRMQNQSTASRVLNYSVSSLRGWVTPFSGSTASVPPLAFTDLNIVYSIPTGTAAGVTDSAFAILTVGPSFRDSSYSRIVCRGAPLGITDAPSFLQPAYSLQCSPNPFNERTTIQYMLPKDSDSRIVIHNILGQAVKTLVNERQTAGIHTISWDGKNALGEHATSGLYFVRFETGDRSMTRRLLLLR